MQKQINLDLKSLYKWLLANKISLNYSKTVFIFFHATGIADHDLKDINQWYQNSTIKLGVRTNGVSIAYLVPFIETSLCLKFKLKISIFESFPK